MKNSVLIIFLLIIGYSYTQQTGTFTDSHDGKVYKNVVIGKQTWMSDNLNVNHFRNGDQIPEAKTAEEWIKAGENKQPAWCYYDNDPKNGETYGKLYNWYAVIDSRGLAPLGWRIPVESDWSYLIDYLGGRFSSTVKFKSTSGWDLGAISKWIKNSNGTNESGFSGLPGGRCDNLGRFYGIGQNGYWWSSTEFNGSSTGVLWGAYCCDLTYYFEGIANILPGEKKNGCSIRFIKEINEVSNQVDTTGINIPITNLTNQETTKINTGSSPKCLNGDCNNGVGQWQYTDGSYSGEWKNSQRNGKGTFTGTNGDSYVGDYFEGARDGKGKYQWKNGDVYDGDWLKDSITGFGKYTYFNGSIFEGYFVNGEQNGKGKKTFLNGEICIGDFVNNKLHGKGKYSWTNGETYDGDWLNGEQTGNCTWTSPNGEIYIGDVVNKKFNGKGKYFFKNGDVYDGDFLNGDLTGFGKWIFSNGNKYEGAIINGKRNGNGIFHWKNGEVYDGDWVNNQRTGKGKYFFINGDVYEGDYANDERTGKGKMILKNGESYEGEFVNGQIIKNEIVQLPSWNNGRFKQIDEKSSNYNNVWTEGDGQLKYEELSRKKYFNTGIEVILSDLNAGRGMLIKLTEKGSFWKLLNDNNWQVLSQGNWTITPNWYDENDVKYRNENGLKVAYINEKPLTGTIYSNREFLKVEINYKNGLLDGKCIRKYENGDIESEENYVNGKKFGWQRYYKRDGKIIGEVNLINGNGKLLKYHESNGKISSETNYQNGMMNGEYRSYWANGKIFEIKNIKNDILDGYYSMSNEKGIYLFETNLKNGIENGLKKIYDEDGNLTAEVEMINGAIVCIITSSSYFRNRKEADTKYRCGEKNWIGFEKMWYTWPEVKLRSEGKIIMFKFSLANSRLSEVKKDSIWKTWHYNGQLESVGNYIENLQDGKWKTWFDNGQLKSEGTFKLGKKEGIWKTLYDNGKIASDGNYTNDLPDGLWKSWYSNGQLTSSGNYIAEQKNGSWKFYNEAGKLISDENYSNGKMNGLFTKYFDSGKLSSMKNYKNDIKDGNWKTYNEKGIVTEQEFYKNGKKDGIFITRHSNGVKSSEATYKDGALVSDLKRFDEKGVLIIPQVVINNNQNPNQNNNNQNYQTYKEKCFNCKGTGNCEYCTIFFNTRDWGGNSRGWVSEQKTNPGYVMCTGCYGSGRIYGIPSWPNDPTYKDCTACSNGWQKCNKCYWSKISKCSRCNASGYSE